MTAATRIPATMAISPGMGPEPLEPWLEGLMEAGVEALQVREKGLDDRGLYELVRRLVGRAGGRCVILVNGRFDLALAAGAAGVHLPADGLPAGPLRRRCGPDFLIGRSTHQPAEVEAARLEGCDYALFGPVRPTPGKGEAAGIPGFAGLAAACRLGLPVLALGGIATPEDLEDAARAGAAGFAAIRAFEEPAAAAELVARARTLWPRAAGEPA